jgi:DNA primase
MPGVDFDRLCVEVPMDQVLDLLGFQSVSRSGPQWYGRCPIHESRSKRSRCFSVNLTLGRYYCHRCHSHGNQLDLWAAATQLPLYPAALDLCQRLGREVPWIHRW